MHLLHLGNYRTYLLFVFIFLNTKSVLSQKDHISYVFEDTVKKTLIQELEYEISIRDTSLKFSDFYIEIATCNNKLTLDINLIKGDNLGEIVEKSNRLIVVNNQNIKIISSQDLEFSTLFSKKKIKTIIQLLNRQEVYLH